MKLPREIIEALDATGLPWTAENGGRHIKLKLAGRLVASLGRTIISDRDRRPTLNIISQIKRAARGV